MFESSRREMERNEKRWNAKVMDDVEKGCFSIVWKLMRKVGKVKRGKNDYNFLMAVLCKMLWARQGLVFVLLWGPGPLSVVSPNKNLFTI